MPRKRKRTGRPRGRPRGSKLYPADRALCDCMASLIVNRLVVSVWQAARLVAPRAGGAGTERSRAQRLHDLFQSKRPEFMRRARTPSVHGLGRHIAQNGFPILNLIGAPPRQPTVKEIARRVTEAAAAPDADALQAKIIGDAEALTVERAKAVFRMRALLDDGGELN